LYWYAALVGFRQPYTWAGPSVLVAVNPLLPLPPPRARYFYGRRSATSRGLPPPPHPFALAEAALQRLVRAAAATHAAAADATEPSSELETAEPLNQSLVLLGESGSGKTETARLLVSYLHRRAAVVAAEDGAAAHGSVRTAGGNGAEHSGKDGGDGGSVCSASSSEESDKSGFGLGEVSASSSSSSSSSDSDGSDGSDGSEGRRRLRTAKAVGRASQRAARKAARRAARAEATAHGAAAGASAGTARSDRGAFGLAELLALLECFGHALTPRNPNASRCGRFVKVHYAAVSAQRPAAGALNAAAAPAFDSRPAPSSSSSSGAVKSAVSRGGPGDSGGGSGGAVSHDVRSGSRPGSTGAATEWVRVGASVEVFGLELGRATCGGFGHDRSFHALYELLGGAPPALRQRLQLPDPLADRSGSAGNRSRQGRSRRPAATASADSRRGAALLTSGSSAFPYLPLPPFEPSQAQPAAAPPGRRGGVRAGSRTSTHNSTRSGAREARAAFWALRADAFGVASRALERLSQQGSGAGPAVVVGGGGDPGVGSGGKGRSLRGAGVGPVGSSDAATAASGGEGAASVAWRVAAAVLHLGRVRVGEADSDGGRVATLHPRRSEQVDGDDGGGSSSDGNEGDGSDGRGESGGSSGSSSSSSSSGDDDDNEGLKAGTAAGKRGLRGQQRRSAASLEAAAAILGVSASGLSDVLTERRMGLASGDAFTVREVVAEKKTKKNQYAQREAVRSMQGN
jgi:hypothetical protein